MSDDPEALFDALVAENVLAVGGQGTDGRGVGGGEIGADATADEDGGRVRTTDEFDDTHAVYHDSYVGLPDEEFHEAVAATFGLPDADAAAELLATRDASRTEFVCYLAVKSHLDLEASPDDLAAMAAMVREVVPDSPVPSALADVTDDPATVAAERDRAVVTVWKHFCDPCESLKADLRTVLGAVPEDVTVAGIDGEVATDFCRSHAVDSAPGVVLVRDGDRRTITGSDASAMVAAIREFFGE